MKPSAVLEPACFEQDTVRIAKSLLGNVLCRRFGDRRILRLAITETEAYDGWDDRASHAHAGITPRTAVMFGPPGHWYVYLCYGMHWMLNLVTREAGYPAAVLIRGCEKVVGPGRLTRFLGINAEFNRKPALRSTGLWIEEGSPDPECELLESPRVGVAYAGLDWAARPWRFRLAFLKKKDRITRLNQEENDPDGAPGRDPD